MSLVLDASAALAWVFEDEQTPEGEALLDRVADQGAVVPGLWRLEVVNGLRSAARRRRITPDYGAAVLLQFAALPIKTDPETDARAWGEIAALSARLDLTPYDAAYLELAQRLGLALATGDENLRAAASRLGINLWA